MSRFSKVAWKEGLFLKPHHLQQADRYLEHLIASNLLLTQAYPWGIIDAIFDEGQLKSGHLELGKIVGVFADGTAFSAPSHCPLPVEVAVDEKNVGKTIWLTLPNAAQNGQDVGFDENGPTRYRLVEEQDVTDNSLPNRNTENIEVAVPRLELKVRDTAPDGYQCISLGRIADVSDGVIVNLDQTVPPTGMVINCHRAYKGYLKSVLGAVEAKIEVLDRYAADLSSGGGMQDKDYLILLVLNRSLPVLRHLQNLPIVHPERLYETLISLVGELSTFEDNSRRVKDYGRYKHDRPKETFQPIVEDIRQLLSRDTGRAIRIELQDRGENRFAIPVHDATLFSRAAFYIEVKADLPLTQVQQDFPSFCKVAPGSRIREIVTANLPGLNIIHIPNPPRQIRHVSGHVYFLIDKISPLWREFSQMPAMGMQIAGAWPGLELEIWAIPED